MKQNMGILDRTIRILVAVVLLLTYYYGDVNGLTGIVVFIIAALLALTGILGVCPIYSLLGINTCRSRNKVHNG